MCRADSMVVRFPTDLSLLWDSACCLIRCCYRAARLYDIDGWLQHAHWARSILDAFHAARQRPRAQKNRHKAVRHYLRLCTRIEAKACGLLALLPAGGTFRDGIEYYLGCLRLLSDQVRRCILEGETIPHDEKISSRSLSDTSAGSTRGRWGSRPSWGCWWPWLKINISLCCTMRSRGRALMWT